MEREEKNKAVIRQLMAAFNGRDREAFDACYADEIVVHSRAGDHTYNHEEHWEQVQGLFKVFPDWHETVLRMVAEGDHVLLYWNTTATHLGRGQQGIEPTGKKAGFRGFSDYRLEDGKVVEAWQIYDMLDLYRQLGLVELPGGSD